MLFSLLTKLYCNLTYFGVRIKPPLCLFHQPNLPLPHKYLEHLSADINFTSEERWLIIEGANNLEWFCDQMIQFKITFDYDPNQANTFDRPVILRTSSRSTIIQKADGYYQHKILGLCNYDDKNNAIIYLVHNRLKMPHMFRTTILHELGHYVGMNHIDQPSIMSKYNDHKTLYMTKKDAIEFARLYKIDVEQLRYFKLT